MVGQLQIRKVSVFHGCQGLGWRDRLAQSREENTCFFPFRKQCFCKAVTSPLLHSLCKIPLTHRGRVRAAPLRKASSLLTKPFYFLLIQDTS